MTAGEPVGGQQTLSRELSVFLVQFSIGLHKFATYPTGHPVVGSAIESVSIQLLALLSERETVAIGVARNQLIVEGVATDAKSAVLTELAHRLHSHQVGLVRFQRGVETAEIMDLLATLSPEANREGIPFGLRPPEELDRWANISVVPLTFDQLHLDDEGNQRDEDNQESRLWLGLAAAALRQEDDDKPAMDNPKAVADAINNHKGDRSYDQVIVGYLQQLGRELKMQTGTDAGILHERVTQLLSGLDETTLARLMDSGGDLAKRTELLAEFSRSLPVDAVMDLVTAAAKASEQTISHSLLRMLSKLADHSTSSQAFIQPQADANFRESIGSLLDNWTLDDPNPDAYTRLLDRLSTPGDEAPTEFSEGASEAPRIIQMCLEVDAFGPAGESAIGTMLQTSQFLELLEILDNAPKESEALAGAWRCLASPENVAVLLEKEERDLEGVQRVLDRLGVEAAGPLIDALATSESRAMRHRLLQTLTALGPGVAPVAAGRLEGAPWYVLRNLLILLGALGVWPDTFSPEEYARHEDARVRREALKLMLQADDNDLTAAAIQIGVADEDQIIIRMGLTAAIGNCPTESERYVLRYVSSDDSDLRVLAIRVLTGIRKTRAREILVDLALTKRKWWHRRRRLAGPSPEMLAAVAALAEAWAGTPEVEYILEMARESPHLEIRSVINEA